MKHKFEIILALIALTLLVFLPDEDPKHQPTITILKTK